MIGYMDANEALRVGFTHHGKYWGIPIWVAEDQMGLMVAAKWEPMEIGISLFHYIEIFFRTLIYPNEEPCFQFLVGKEIKPPVE